MAALASERRTYTALEFLELAADLELAGSQEWHEIIGGELVAHASPVDPHMRAAMGCLKLLLDAQWAGYGRAGNDRMVVLDYRGPTVPAADVYKPDAFFVVREREAILDHPELASVVGTPTLWWKCSPRTPPATIGRRAPRSSAPTNGPASASTGSSTSTGAPSRFTSGEENGWWRPKRSDRATRCAAPSSRSSA